MFGHVLTLERWLTAILGILQCFIGVIYTLSNAVYIYLIGARFYGCFHTMRHSKFGGLYALNISKCLYLLKEKPLFKTDYCNIFCVPLGVQFVLYPKIYGYKSSKSYLSFM